MRMTKKAKELYRRAYKDSTIWELVYTGLDTAIFNEASCSLKLERDEFFEYIERRKNECNVDRFKRWYEDNFSTMMVIREIFGDACDFMTDEELEKIRKQARIDAYDYIKSRVDEVPEAYRPRN